MKLTTKLHRTQVEVAVLQECNILYAICMLTSDKGWSSGTIHTLKASSIYIYSSIAYDIIDDISINYDGQLRRELLGSWLAAGIHKHRTMMDLAICMLTSDKGRHYSY